jgi:glutamyl-tRNA synthetase
MNIEIIVKDWMTKMKLEWESNATVPFEFGWCFKGPHLFDIVELIGKKETITRIQKSKQFIKKKPPILEAFFINRE